VWVAGSNCRARAFLLGEMATEVALGEEFVLVYVGDGGLRRCEVALLRREEAGLAGYVDLGGRASRRVRSGPATRRSRSRESKVDGIREESVCCPPLVTVLHTFGNGGVGWCNFGHSQELELSRALGSARAQQAWQHSTEGFGACAKEEVMILEAQWVPRKLKEGSTYRETTKTVILTAWRDAQGRLVV
jgi:hypothetical protein